MSRASQQFGPTFPVRRPRRRMTRPQAASKKFATSGRSRPPTSRIAARRRRRMLGSSRPQADEPKIHWLVRLSQAGRPPPSNVRAIRRSGRSSYGRSMRGSGARWLRGDLRGGIHLNLTDDRLQILHLLEGRRKLVFVTIFRCFATRASTSHCSAPPTVGVRVSRRYGTRVCSRAGRGRDAGSPSRSVRAVFPHAAPTADVQRRIARCLEWRFLAEGEDSNSRLPMRHLYYVKSSDPSFDFYGPEDPERLAPLCVQR